ncbi:UNVERIFIED_CONTAM: Kinetochore protein NDC80 [Sesamum radiatum]|uniref:Kinetochore protein NDC80 n=1 Tax=Sesamum radiatum TaxID=300843 RepID=A0AAW2MX99_SESRA
MKFLRCPLKLNKSALRAPGTPHSWPNLLAVIHWLVQIIKYNDFMMNSSPSFESDKQFMYTINSYLLYIRGDDEAADVLDEECIREMREWRDKVEEQVTLLEENVKELELDGHLVEVQKKLEEKDKALEAKAVERDIEETEAARNGWEEKIWELDSEIGHKFKELERFMMECNQAIRRLKLGSGFQYQLNAKGSTPSEVLGLDYKSILKPALASFAEDLKRSSMGKLEDLISLRQQSGENAVKLEEKRNRIAVLQTHIDDVEAQLNTMRKETQDYVSRCAAEAKKLAEEVEMEAEKMSVVEKEAAEFLKTSKAELQETIMQTEEEVKLCAQELFDLINSVSTYKEYMGSKIARMRNDLLETAGTVADIYKGYRPSQSSVVMKPSN